MAKRTIQYGYKLENGAIAIDYGEAEIVREECQTRRILILTL